MNDQSSLSTPPPVIAGSQSALGGTVSKSGQWMVLLAAFLGWMFDGMEMGIFPIAARPAIMDMMKLTDKDPIIITTFEVKDAAALKDKDGKPLANAPATFTALNVTERTRGEFSIDTTTGLNFMLSETNIKTKKEGTALRPEIPKEGQPMVNKMREGTVAGWMGVITALFLLGAAAGGLIFGWLGDRIGRVKAMTFSVLVYSLFTGAGYFAQEPWHLGAFRFIAALGMGGEWSLGVALIMECWPSKHRPILAGLIGAAANVGFALIGIITWIRPVKADDWRWVMLTGAAPAVLTFFIRLFVPESEKWKESVKKTPATQSPLRVIFTPPLLRKTLFAILFASIALIGTWGSVQSIPAWIGKISDDPSSKSMAQIFSAVGAIFGSIAGSMLGQILGRRPAYFLLCLGSLISCAVLFRGFDTYSTNMLMMIFVVGFVTAAFYGWLPLYLPELFPTSVRATGQGLSFNFGRIFTAVAVLNIGSLVSYYNGSWAKMCAVVSLIYVFGMVFIWLAPETKGKPLPD